MVSSGPASFAQTAAPSQGATQIKTRGLLQVAPNELVTCEVLLTEQTVEFNAQTPGGEFGSMGSYSRSDCELIGSRRIPSGELLVIRHPEGVARLYFPAEQLGDATRLRDELMERTVDTVLLVQEFANLVDSPTDEEADDY